MTSVEKHLRGVVVTTCVVVLIAACGQPSRTDAVADAEALFPTLAQYGVTNLYRTDECEYIAYARGAFVTNPDSDDCQIDVEGPYPRARIGEQARADLDAIYRASERHGARLQSAFPEYDANGTVNGGSFGFDWCTMYIYEPDWVRLPAQDSMFVTAIDRNWYEIRCETG